MVAVGILKKYTILKFILLIINQGEGLLISHFLILSWKRKQLQTFKTKMKNVFSGVFLDIFIQQILMIQDQQTQNNNQNRLNLLKKNNKNFIKQSFAIFVKTNYTMTIQQAKCSKSEAIVTFLESIVVQHLTFATFNVASQWF